MDALIVERIGEWRLEELRREAAGVALAREARRLARGGRGTPGDDPVWIRIAAGSAAGEHRDGRGRLVTRTAAMLQDPFMLKELGTQRQEALRRDAATRAQLGAPVAGWRRTAGYSLVRVGLRLLRHPAPADVLERALP